MGTALVHRPGEITGANTRPTSGWQMLERSNDLWQDDRRHDEERAMGIHRLNHAVLYVRDVEKSIAFYGGVLGFTTKVAFPGAAFLQAPGSTNDHDLGLFQVGQDAAPSPAGRGAVGLYHLAWEVETLDDLEDHLHRLSAAGALVGMSDHGTTKSLYATDPDGIEFEVVWLIPANLLTGDEGDADPRPKPLDLAKEKARYGGSTRGGIGISIPVGVSV
jgi:catechol 2,3-dioxygenase-like lactoylglutathione lyase family enzyme